MDALLVGNVNDGLALIRALQNPYKRITERLHPIPDGLPVLDLPRGDKRCNERHELFSVLLFKLGAVVIEALQVDALRDDQEEFLLTDG